MSATYDAVIIGGGHNGLSCAAFLSKAGMKVLVLEAAATLGGGARESDLGDGFRAPALAHILHGLHPAVAKELDLARHGLDYAAAALSTVALVEGGGHVVLPGDGGPPAGINDGEAQSWQKLKERLHGFARALQPMMTETPPRLGTRSAKDLITLGKLGLAIRRLGRDDMRELLRVIGMNVADLAEDELTNATLRGLLAFDAVLGTKLGPRAPGTVLTLLYRMAGSAAGRQGALAVPRGGMAALAASMGAAAASHGASVRTGARVARVTVEGDRAAGVVLENGETIAARVVISNADPARTFLELVGPAHFDTGFIRKVRAIRMAGVAAKLNLALDALPEGPGLDPTRLAGRLVWAPSINHVERAADAVKYRRHSAEPVIEAIIPSLADPALAPAGKHVLSAIVQYAPRDIEGGWEGKREAFADLAVATLEKTMPGLGRLVRARQLLLPGDIEREFSMTGGHWHHGELAIDQLMMLRPVPGAAQYATPLDGLFLCGAGAHPGGGIMGVAGMNAAREVVARRGRA